MSRTPRNELAATELGNRLSSLRDQHPDPATPKVIERWLLREFGLEVSDENVRLAHAGKTDPTACQADLLAGLAAFYEVAPSELGRFAEQRLRRVFAMAGLTASGPDGDPSDLANSQSGWTSSLDDAPVISLFPISQPATQAA